MANSRRLGKYIDAIPIGNNLLDALLEYTLQITDDVPLTRVILPVELIANISLVEGIVITPDVNVSVPLIVKFPERVAPFILFRVIFWYEPPPESACAVAPPVRITAPAPDPVIEPAFDIFPLTVIAFTPPSNVIEFHL